MAGPLIWNGLNAKALTRDILLDNAYFQDLRVGNQLSRISSTGIIEGGILSINDADPTLFDLTGGTGQLIDYATPTIPTTQKITWPTSLGVTVDDMAGQTQTYILIDGGGNIVQQHDYPLPSQRRNNIFIGVLNYAKQPFSGPPVIIEAFTFPDFPQSVAGQAYDLFDALGPFNITGNVISPGTSARIIKSFGTVFFRDFNYLNEPNSPNVKNTGAQDPLFFSYYSSTNTNSDPEFPEEFVDPSLYESPTGITSVPGAATASTTQRIYLSPSGQVNIQYGQTVWPDLSTAVNSIPSEPFTPNPYLASTCILIGYISMQRNMGATSDATRCRIIRAAKFDAGQGGGAIAAPSLQGVYNSSVPALITLSTSPGTLTIRDAATPIASSLFTIASNNGGINYLNVTPAAVSTASVLNITNATTSSSTTTGALLVTGGVGIGGAANIGGTLTSNNIIVNGLVPDSAVVTNSSKQLVSSTASTTQISYLATTTSDVQTQIDYRGTRGNYILDPLLLKGNSTFWSLGTTGTLTAGLPTGVPTFGSGASGNLTVSATSVSPLEGAFSLRYQHLTNQTVAGNMMSSAAIPISVADRSKILAVKFSYSVTVGAANGNFSGGAASSFGVACWDITNAAWLPVSGPLGITQSSGTGIFTGTVTIASSTSSVRFVFYNANATSATSGGGAITLLMDDFYFGPQLSETVAARAQGSTLSFTSGSLSGVNWVSVAYDTHNAMSLGGSYTCPASGKFAVTLTLTSSATIAAAAIGNSWVPTIRRNGNGVANIYMMAQTTTAILYACTVTDTIQCNAGDTISAALFHNLGVTVSLVNDPTKNYMTITRVGN